MNSKLTSILSTCVHCSAACPLEYELSSDTTNGVESISSVKNCFDFVSCKAGSFGFAFTNNAFKNEVAFSSAIAALRSAKGIRFSSMITNEEAHVLQLLKAKLGLKLFNEDARLYADFMKAYGSISGKLHHSGSLDAIMQSEVAIVIGTRIATDNPAVRYALASAYRNNDAIITYAHPIEDASLGNMLSQFVKYEAGTEEGVIALLANELLSNVELSSEDRAYFDELDLGYLEAESNVGDDELKIMSKAFENKQKRVLIIGSDILSHKHALNIARFAAIIEKYTSFSLVVIPTEINTVGVSLIAELDVDERDVDGVVGYNAHGEFIISAFDEADLTVAALNQQQGTIVNIDNEVLPLQKVVSSQGYSLNDLANALDVAKESATNYTRELNCEAGFQALPFDAIDNTLDGYGTMNRGYLLNEVNCQISAKLEEVSDLPEYNGTVIYHSNPLEQFNAYTNCVKKLERDTTLRGSAQFAAAARVSDGDELEISTATGLINRVFKLESELKGTIALNPMFDASVTFSGYKFEKSNIKRIG